MGHFLSFKQVGDLQQNLVVNLQFFIWHLLTQNVKEPFLFLK
jgi:hypothetical protein